jgi:hypothetical protein
MMHIDTRKSDAARGQVLTVPLIASEDAAT